MYRYCSFIVIIKMDGLSLITPGQNRRMKLKSFILSLFVKGEEKQSRKVIVVLGEKVLVRANKDPPSQPPFVPPTQTTQFVLCGAPE